MDDDMDDVQPEPGRLYRPLNRTPPEYQTVIKFLLMASILDSVWVSGPPQTGSPCGLVGAPGDHGDRRQDAGGADGHPACWEAPADDHPAPARPIPSDIREALRQLNITAEDWSRDPDEVRLGGVTPVVLRVLSLMVFNAFVVWSDFGAALLGPAILGPAAFTGAPGTPGVSAAPQWLEAGSGARGPDIAWPRGGAGGTGAGNGECAEAGSDAAAPWTAGPAHRAPASRAPACTTATSRTLGVWNAPVKCVRPGGTPKSDGGTATPPKTSAAKGGDLYTADDTAVPWFIQLFYVVTLIAVIVSSPCCPVVFENACTFLMC